MALRPSSVPLRVPLPPPPESSLPAVLDPESDLACAASPTVSRLLVTVVTDPSFESAAASALVAELLDFAAAFRLDYAIALVAESVSASPPSVGGECALGMDVLEDGQKDFECLAAAVPRFASMLLAPEGDPDAPDILTPHSYAEAITGPYSSQWQSAMDAEMASWKSTGTYVDKVPPPWANIVDGMWIFRVKRPLGSPPAFKAHYIARGFSQRQGVDYFQTFSPTPKMTTLRASRVARYVEDYACGSWVCSFYCRDTSLLPFYVLVYLDDLVFATTDTEALTLVKSELQKRHTCTDLGELRNYLGLHITWDRARRTITLIQSHMVHQVLQSFGFQFSSPQPTPLSTGHSLSAPPLDKSVEPSGPYPELVGCLMYLMTCIRPDLAYPLSLLARYVAPSTHRKVHWDAEKRVLRYLCSTLGMGLVLGERGPVVLTGHADASWRRFLPSASCALPVVRPAVARAAPEPPPPAPPPFSSIPLLIVQQGGGGYGGGGSPAPLPPLLLHPPAAGAAIGGGDLQHQPPRPPPFSSIPLLRVQQWGEGMGVAGGGLGNGGRLRGVNVVKPAAPVTRETVAPVAHDTVAPIARESVAPAARLAAEPVTPVAHVPVAPFASVPVALVARVPAASATTHHLLSSHGPSSSSLALSFLRCHQKRRAVGNRTHRERRRTSSCLAEHIAPVRRDPHRMLGDGRQPRGNSHRRRRPATTRRRIVFRANGDDRRLPRHQHESRLKGHLRRGRRAERRAARRHDPRMTRAPAVHSPAPFTPHSIHSLSSRSSPPQPC
ncbi:unnamed protein product [Closterium sp. NIES-54]